MALSASGKIPCLQTNQDNDMKPKPHKAKSLTFQQI